MDIRLMKESIISTLRTLPVCIPAKQNTQWVVRCPYCGDSHDPTHAHLSIHIDADINDWMPARCLKCNATAYVNPRFLSELGLYLPEDIESMLNIFNKRTIKENHYVSKEVSRVIPKMNKDALLICGRAKAEYIGLRIGVDPEIIEEKAADLKIILDYITFCKVNDIVITDKTWKKSLFLNFNYVGFLSSNGNCITFRDFRNEKGSTRRRYDKMIIDPKNLNANTFYNIPFAYDYTDLEDWHIHIAEGTFDIISVYFNCMNQNEDHHAYFACCGFSYTTILKYLLSNGIAMNLILHLYSDNDKTDDDLRKMFRKQKHLLQYVKELYVHRNTYTHEDGSHEKDFGVKYIQDRSYELAGI